MRKPKALIAEDEPNQLIGLKKMLQRFWPELQICGEAADGETALALIGQTRPDVVFLDIKMPLMSGLEVARQVHEQCRIVFVTAFDRYAVQAFENEAVDYLLKPISEERLAKTVARLKNRLDLPLEGAERNPNLAELLERLNQVQASGWLQLIKVKCGAEVRLIPTSQICFFKAENKYTTVQTAHGEFVIRTAIKELAESLDPGSFWQVHRSAIVNIHQVDKIKRTFSNRLMVAFKNTDKTIKVSGAYEHLFRHM